MIYEALLIEQKRIGYSRLFRIVIEQQIVIEKAGSILFMLHYNRFNLVYEALFIVCVAYLLVWVEF
jgi:hypothetical protein